jgi:hypothetical protein
VNELEQTLVLSVSAVIVLTTLVIVVWQLWRGRGRGDDD